MEKSSIFTLPNSSTNIIILSWSTDESDLDEGLFLGWIVQLDPSVDVFLPQTDVLDPSPDVHEGLGSWKHVERDRKRPTVVDVVHPETSAGELPLHVTLFLIPKEQPVRGPYNDDDDDDDDDDDG